MPHTSDAIVMKYVYTLLVSGHYVMAACCYEGEDYDGVTAHLLLGKIGYLGNNHFFGLSQSMTTVKALLLCGWIPCLKESQYNK